MRNQHLLIALLLPACLLLIGFLFWPGMTGPWFFDDLHSLPKIGGSDGTADSMSELLRLVFPYHQGSGRSLSYLSLLIDDNNWPTDPWQFKLTNLLLHLLNAVLVFGLVRTILRVYFSADLADTRPEWIALIGMALWAMNPMQLSPVMMVIQRMTLLGGGFSLLALLAYVHGRRQIPSRPIVGLVFITLVFGLFLLLGILSKEIALITVLYVVVIELTLFSKDRPVRPKYFGVWVAVFVGLPLLLTVTYIVAIWSPGTVEAYSVRDFTPVERVLTQSRVLIDYLRGIVTPTLSQFGPIHDDYLPSRGLLTPINTALSLALVLGLTGLAFWFRRRWGVFAFAILWFFLGHALESGPLCLELYFEHRNYLPMLGIYVALGYLVVEATRPYRKWAFVGAGVFFMLLGSLTFTVAQVWGSQQALALIWSAEHPRSSRAQALAFQLFAAQGDGISALKQIEAAIFAAPENLSNYMFLLMIDGCLMPDQKRAAADIETIKNRIPNAHFETGVMEVLTWITGSDGRESCQISLGDLKEITELMLQNSKFNSRSSDRANLHIIKSRICRRQGDFRCTMDAMNQVFAAWPDYQVALQQAYDYAEAGLFDVAEGYLMRAEAAPPVSHADRFTRNADIATVREAIRALQKGAVADRDSLPKPPPLQAK